MTLNGVIALSLRTFPKFSSFWVDYIKVAEDTPYFLPQKCRSKNQVFSSISLTAILAGDHP